MQNDQYGGPEDLGVYISLTGGVEIGSKVASNLFRGRTDLKGQ